MQPRPNELRRFKQSAFIEAQERAQKEAQKELERQVREQVLSRGVKVRVAVDACGMTRLGHAAGLLGRLRTAALDCC